jgi:hypothetical protein
MCVRANLQRLNQRLLIVTSSIQWATAPSGDVLPPSASFQLLTVEQELTSQNFLRLRSRLGSNSFS